MTKLDYRLYPRVLDNGLRVITVEVPHLHGAMVTVFVGTGSRHEDPGVNGVSHFLEHIFFRGCEKYPDSMVLNSVMEGVGGSLNAATARDHGYYYTAVHPEQVEFALGICGEMLTRPRFAEVELEREVILEEILDEVDEDGNVIDPDQISKRLLFGDVPLAMPVGGSTQSVKRITEDDLRSHHKRAYAATNMVVCVAGPVDPDAVVRQCEASFGSLPEGEKWPAGPPPALRDGLKLSVVHRPESQSEVRLSFPGPRESDPEYGAVIVLRRILDDGLASRLQQNIVEKRGLAYSVSAWSESFIDLGLFELDAACAHAKVPALLDALQETLDELCRIEPTVAELDRVKTRHRCAIEFMQDAAGDLAGWFGEAEINGLPVTLESRLAEVQAVQPEQVRAVAQQIFDPGKMATVVVGKAKLEDVRAAVARVSGVRRE